MSYVVGIENGGVVISDSQFKLTPVTSVDEYLTYFFNEANRLGVFIAHLQIYNSSSMDFPHEETNDPKVLELVEAIHNL